MSNEQQSPYPFDGTGINPGNLVTREHHSLTNANSDAYHSIIVRFPPFFEEDLIVEKKIGEEYFPLDIGIDYNLGFRAEDISKLLRKPVMSQVAMNPIGTNDGIFITYRTIGGGNIIDYEHMAVVIKELLRNPRMAVWDNVVMELSLWTPSSHNLDANDIGSFGDVIKSINRLEESLAGREASQLLTHITDKSAHGLGFALQEIDERLKDLERKIIAIERVI